MGWHVTYDLAWTFLFIKSKTYFLNIVGILFLKRGMLN